MILRRACAKPWTGFPSRPIRRCEPPGRVKPDFGSFPMTMTTATTLSPRDLCVEFHGCRFPLEHVACDFCAGTEFHPFWDRMRHALNLPTVFCKNCGLCMTNPRPTAE